MTLASIILMATIIIGMANPFFKVFLRSSTESHTFIMFHKSNSVELIQHGLAESFIDSIRLWSRSSLFI